MRVVGVLLSEGYLKCRIGLSKHASDAYMMRGFLLLSQGYMRCRVGVSMQVMAALGAEQVIQHCGGLRCLLGAVGVNLSMALPDTARWAHLL
jgi:hypothetical protein